MNLALGPLGIGGAPLLQLLGCQGLWVGGSRPCGLHLCPGREPTPAAWQTVAGGRARPRARPPEVMIPGRAHPEGMPDAWTAEPLAPAPGCRRVGPRADP